MKQSHHKPPRTLNELLDNSAEKFSSRPAMGFAFATPLTYGQVYGQVKAVSSWLQSRGMGTGDHVAVLGENSPQWAVAYLAIVRLGAVAVPILPDFTGPDTRHIINDSGIKILFTTQRQLEKIYELDSRQVEQIITLDDFEGKNEVFDIETFSNVVNAGRQTLISDNCTLSVHPDDPASIIYTSGTSGHSKAVILSHRNLCSNVLAADQLIDITSEKTFLSILPMSHTYEFTIGFLLPLLNGARIVFAGKSPTPSVLEKICAMEKPNALCIVPVVMEKIYKKKVLPALSGNRFISFGVNVPVLRNIIFSSIRRKLIDFFGGHLEVVAIGGAPMINEIELFFAQAGFPYIVGYGLTESSPLLAAGPFGDPSVAVGSSGKPVPGVEIKIANPDPETGIGEILARGPNIMTGYYKNPELTAQTIDEHGWMATGDLGRINSGSNLFITGRSKNVIVLPHGENIYPESIEDKINARLHISESLVIENNGRLEALVYLDYDLISQETRGMPQVQQKEFISELLIKLKKEINSLLPKYSQISRFIERTEPFTKTATHKIKRYLYTDGS